MNAPPVYDGLGDPWYLVVWRLWEALQGLLVEEQAKEGGVATVEEEEEEEDEEQRGPSAGRVVPL